jgi:hypothetical protein
VPHPSFGPARCRGATDAPLRPAGQGRQLDADPRPVARPADFAALDLDRAFALVFDMAAGLGDAR